MDENTTPVTLTPRDQARVEITTRLIAGVMTGHMAAGKSLEEALSAAERSRDVCLVSAGTLFDACTQDYPADGLEKQRIGASTDLFCAAVSGLVARGDDAGKALRTVGASREHIVRSANGNVLAALDTTIKIEAKPLSSTIAAFRNDQTRPGQRGPRPGGGNSPIL